MKKMYSRKLMVVTMIVLAGLCGCNKDIANEPIAITFEKDKRITEISKSDVPDGVAPIVLKSKEELYELMDKIDRIELDAQLPSIGKTNRLRSSAIESAPATSNITANLGGRYTIIIHLAYEKKGQGAVSVSSENSTTWLFATWTQTSGVAGWKDPETIAYSITGDIKWYAVIQSDWFEIDKKNMSVDGYVRV